MEATGTKLIVKSEEAHWYLKDGTPFYEIENKSKPGTTRPTTLRDAKKHGAAPSVNGIIDMAAKPGLQIWKMNQLLMASLTLPKLPDEKLDDYAKRVVEDYQVHAAQAAERGKAIHAAIQNAYEGQTFDEQYATHVNATRAAVEKAFPGVTDWECEQTFYHPLGYGGKVDMYSREHRIVIDFKTKEFAPEDIMKGLGYDEQAMQLAGYGQGLKLEQPTIANIFVSASLPGLVHVHKWDEEERLRALKMFHLLREYWVLSKGYNPAAEA